MLCDVKKKSKLPVASFVWQSHSWIDAQRPNGRNQRGEQCDYAKDANSPEIHSTQARNKEQCEWLHGKICKRQHYNHAAYHQDQTMLGDELQDI